MAAAEGGAELRSALGAVVEYLVGTVKEGGEGSEQFL